MSNNKLVNLESLEAFKDHVAAQYVILPTAAAGLEGKIYQYVGATNANYVNGYFYKCVNNGGVYSWYNVNGSTVTKDYVDNIQPATIQYLTTAPIAANTSGLKFVVLSAEPATKYDGYLYIITE